MPGEKSAIIFLQMPASTVILIFFWVTQEYRCRYPQITEFIPWLIPHMEISGPKNSTFRKKRQWETRALQWQRLLNISISLTSTWSGTWLIADSAGYPYLLGISSHFLLNKPGWWLFLLVKLERYYSEGFLHVFSIEWLLGEHREGPISLIFTFKIISELTLT